MESSSLGSPSGETADLPLTIGKRELERAFQSIIAQLGGRSHNGITSGGTEGRNHDENYRERTRKCCCGAPGRNHDGNEVPSFSVSFSNPSCCSSNDAAHNLPYRTSGNHKKVLQIHLPECSKDPCQILITSHRDQVSVKYLQQGQQFTFSTCDSDRTFYGAAEGVSDRIFSNADNATNMERSPREMTVAKEKGHLSNGGSSEAFFNSKNISTANDSLGIRIQDVTSKRKEDAESYSNCDLSSNFSWRSRQGPSLNQTGHSVDEGTVERHNGDIGAFSSLNTESISDSNLHGIHPFKKQKKESLNSFINSLLNKRAREESKKSSDQTDGNTDSEKDQERSLYNQQAEQTNGTKRLAESLVKVYTCDPTSSLFPSDALSEPVNSSLSLSPTPQIIRTSSLVLENPVPRTTVNSTLPKMISKTNLTVQDSLTAKASVKKGRFKCQYCNELFQQRSDCHIHISQHHVEDRPHHCPLCDATFKKRRSLKYHIRHHNGERPYKCTYCDKAFKEKYHLTVHIRTHTGERPFACTQCGKAFKQTNELTSHIRTHTGERPYKCEVCDKWFKRRSQLYNHNLTHLPEHASDSTKINNTEMDSYDVINTEMDSRDVINTEMDSRGVINTEMDSFEEKDIEVLPM